MHVPDSAKGRPPFKPDVKVQLTMPIIVGSLTKSTPDAGQTRIGGPNVAIAQQSRPKRDGIGKYRYDVLSAGSP